MVQIRISLEQFNRKFTRIFYLIWNTLDKIDLIVPVCVFVVLSPLRGNIHINCELLWIFQWEEEKCDLIKNACKSCCFVFVDGSFVNSWKLNETTKFYYFLEIICAQLQQLMAQLTANTSFSFPVMLQHLLQQNAYTALFLIHF